MVNQVKEYLEQQNIEMDGKTLVLAVSGGADSACLLDLFHQLQREKDLKLICVHVNHGLREEASQDEAFVRNLAAEYGVAFRVLHADVRSRAAEEKLSEEEAGRRIRYAFLDEVAEEVQADYVLLAHHHDDSAETVLFNLFRGTGLRGLGGIRPLQGRYLRPLLCVSREEIEKYMEERGLAYVTDASNLNEEYSRNRIRNRILPEAERICLAATDHIATTAEELSAIEEYLAGQTQEAYLRCVRADEAGLLLEEKEYRLLPGVIATRVIHRAIEEAAGSARDISRVHVYDTAALFGREAGRQLSLPYGLKAYRVYDGVRLCKEGVAVSKGPAEELSDQAGKEAQTGKNIVLEGVGTARGEVILPPEPKNIPQKRYTKWFDYDKITYCPIFRKRQDGDYLVIDGSGRRKTLNRYFIDEKIPSHERDSVWILADGSHVMWVVGHRISAAYKVGAETKKAVCWCITGTEEE